MLRALGGAFEPQRVRLGQEYVKNARGEPDASRAPADLAADQFARWLRARFFAEVRAADSEGLARAQEDHAPLLRRGRSGSDWTGRLRGGSHSAWTTRAACSSPEEAVLWSDLRERLEESLDAHHRVVLRLHLQGEDSENIASRFGCSARTVRRWMERIKNTATGIIGEPNERGRSHGSEIRRVGAERVAA